MRFESKKEKVATFNNFAKRQFKYFLYSLILMIISLLIGIAGYGYFTELEFVDRLYNSSMILSGMGEIEHMNTKEAKMFSSFYAFYSSIAFSGMVVILFTPFAHRFLHFLHLEKDEYY